jgi:phosphatidate phosphatase PAH1
MARFSATSSMVLALLLPAPAARADQLEPCPAPQVARAGWRHRHRTPLVVSSGRAAHSAADPVVLAGQAATLSGKMAYGPASRDLEDEDVVALLATDGCRWREVGRTRTDSDGRVAFAVSALPAGRHEYRLVVPGDGSFGEGVVWVVPPGRSAVVFDIDGTLTQGDEEMIREILLGAVPRPYDAASDVAQAWARAGHLPIYLTGRPYPLTATTRRWLAEQGFPAGPVITASRLEDAGMDRDHVGRYKRDMLLDLQRRARVVIVRAYGNADTDICAYAEAGIDPARTHIVGRLAGRACDAHAATRPLRDYRSHLATLARLPRVTGR